MGLCIPFSAIDRKAGPISPFVAEGIVARIDIYAPRFQTLATDDIDHTAHGIRTIECRRGSLHNFDAAYVV